MPEYKLVMVFNNEGDKMSTMTIADAKTDIIETQAVALMDAIIAADVFRPQKFQLLTKADCKLIATTTSDFFDQA